MQQNSQRMFSANDSPAEEYLQGILPTLTEFEFELDFQVLKNWQNFLLFATYIRRRESWQMKMWKVQILQIVSAAVAAPSPFCPGGNFFLAPLDTLSKSGIASKQEPGISHFFEPRSVLTLPPFDDPILPPHSCHISPLDHSCHHYPTL